MQYLELTAKEIEAMSLSLRCDNDREVASLMGIPYNSVKKLKKYAFDKLGCSSMLEFVVMAQAQNALQLWLCDDITYVASPAPTRHQLIAEQLRKEYAA